MKRKLFTFLAAIMTTVSFAQVTTSALSGVVTDTNGEPLIGATVVAVHTPSGTQYGVATNADGGYAIQGMRPGGPYEITTSYIGYQSTKTTDVTLALGETYNLNTKVSEDASTLEEVVVSAKRTKFAAEKTGASTNISSDQITAMPTVSRSITDIAKISPYGGSGMSFAGADGRSSNFTIDGANFNNNFGLSSSLPGGGNPISLDAIEEIQVVVSPYDVRQSNFIGGGINAITKSGTNKFKGSAYAYHKNQNMRGNTVAGLELGDRPIESNTTYGATFGGPIIKNKLFFFANFEYEKTPGIVNRWRPSTDGVANPDLYISRTTVADMEKVSKHLMDKYGYDTGSHSDFPADQSNMKLLGRLDWNINSKHKLALRYNYTLNRGWRSTNGSSSNCGQRAVENRLSQYSMAFANSMYSMDNKVNSATLDLNSRFTNNLSNQFLVTFSQINDVRGTNSEPFPFIDILDGTGTITPYMSAGYELFTWNNGVNNNVITIKDDVTYYLDQHKLTGGISYEYQMANNSYMRNGTGYYRYNSLDDFLNGAAPETVAVTYGYDGETNPAAQVRFNQFGLYGQDEWTPNDKIKVTAGIRFDALMFNNDDVMRNNAIYALDYNGKQIDTGAWPSTKVQISPRIGFTWDVLGDKSLKVRGGTGLFAGRLPLVFFTNMPTNSGMVQNVQSISTSYSGGVANANPLLAQFAGDMITDPLKLVEKLNGLAPAQFPLIITPEDGVKPKSIQAVDPNFKMPQVWKSSLAVDYQFATAFPMSVTGEFIYNKTVNGVNMSNWNMKDLAGFARLNGPDNRYIFPENHKYNTTDAYILTNTNQGYGYVANATFEVQPIPELNILASYTHTVSKELTGMPGSNAESAFTYTPTIYGPNHASLHNSQYVTPDRFIASLTYSTKNDHFNLFYEAWRGGSNYSFMYDSDLNGDNYKYDLMYIPANESEILFATPDDATRYWEFANSNPYLSENKGGYAEAYSVYSPWSHRINLRYAHDFDILVGKSKNTLQLNFDLMNVANIFNSEWGVSKYMNPSLKSGRILALDHMDPNGQPVFKTNANVKPGVETWQHSTSVGQCWSLQVGVKYMFN